MEYEAAKHKFIEAWGTLGSSWGVSRTMAEIHALLLLSAEPLSMEDIMAELQISRGNTSQSLRQLIGWGLADKTLKRGQRREFYTASKDIYSVAQQVAKERQRRELSPVLATIDHVRNVEGNSAEVKHFKKVTKDIEGFAKQVDGLIERFSKSQNTWLFKLLGKL